MQAGDKNVPVVLLVSDVGYGGKALYVGIDNESAGRTAGYFMCNSLGGRSGNVVSLCHSGADHLHRQRIIGFSQYFADPDDQLVFKQCLVTRDTEQLAYTVVSETLRSDPNIVGVYNAGGGHAGVIKALEQHRRPGDVIYIGHELSNETRGALEKGTMLLTIDQEPELQVQRAIETIEILIGLKNGAPNRSPIPFRIITPRIFQADAACRQSASRVLRLVVEEERLLRSWQARREIIIPATWTSLAIWLFGPMPLTPTRRPSSATSSPHHHPISAIITSGRMSLVWTWLMRFAHFFEKTAAGSSPAKVKWPVSNSRPTVSGVPKSRRASI